VPVDESDYDYRGCAPCGRGGVGVNPVPVYERVDGAWRDGPLLPLAGPLCHGPPAGATPLRRLTRFGAAVGLRDLWMKDESRNPTWSHKDRLAAVAVAKAVELDARAVVVSSTGNHGMSVAAYAAAVGLPAVCLTRETAPGSMLYPLLAFGAATFGVAAGKDRWWLMDHGVREFGWTPMSNFTSPPVGSNPFGVEGYKAISYELIADLGTVPDVVVVPTAYGDAVAGVLRGFEELVARGRARRVPRMVVAEVLGSYGDALRHGLEAPRPVARVPTIAGSIATPTGSYQGLDAVRRSRGTAVTATEDEIAAALFALARTEGAFVEASAAVGFAVLDTLVVSREIDADQTVVVISTASGLKAVETVVDRLPDLERLAPTPQEADRMALAVEKEMT
jgi:threonine synthase